MSVKITGEQATAIGAALQQALRGLVGDDISKESAALGLRKGATAPAPAKGPADNRVETAADAGDYGIAPERLERLYQYIKNRIIDECRIDPILLELLTTRPEIIVSVEPRLVELRGDNLKGRVARLMAAGWFGQQRATSSVRQELARTGSDPVGGGTLSDVLGNFVKDGFLIRVGGGYAFAPGVKVTERELKVT